MENWMYNWKRIPAVSAFSEIWRLLNVFLSIESTAGTSLLSMYSTCGLLKESQVDIDSSIETETPSDSLGEKSMLHGAERVGRVGATS